MSCDTLRGWWAIAKANPALPRSYEAVLWRRICRGDSRAVEELILAHVWLPLWIIGKKLKFIPKRQHDDAVSAAVYAGVCGLFRTILSYDEKRGAKFSTAANAWVHVFIDRELKKEFELIRTPQHYRGKPPRFVSVDMPTTADGARLKDLLPARDEPDQAEAEHRREKLNQGLTKAGLSPQEKKVLILRYGLADGFFRTHDEVGGIMGFSRQRAEQIHAQALEKLRGVMSLEDFQ